ncbi:MAG TPA: cold shock domain-containing protein [Chloroflexota bacterium]|nr:cold shock domain-containing protein [Chloroflexota bacterium]
MLSGTVTQLLPGKRLGFVRPAVGGIPVLFRALAVEGIRFDELTEGQAVTYTLERDLQGRGARAIHVRPVEGPAAPAAPDA